MSTFDVVALHPLRVYPMVWFALASVFLVVLAARATRKRIPKGYRLPPGPRGLPIIGNAANMPPPQEWKTFSRWAQKHGDIAHVNVLGISIVFVNSLGVANDLFEKRSSIYSDRCDFPMLMLMGFDWNLGLMKYGPQWRTHRKSFQQQFHPTVVNSFYPVQTKWTRNLLLNLLQTPEEFANHLRHHSGAIIMEVVYGIRVKDKEDPYLHTAEEAMAAGSIAANPGAFLVDLLPILRHIPEWVPGAGFQKKARQWRVPVRKMIELPFETAKTEMDAGTAQPSVVGSLLISHKGSKLSNEDEELIRNVVGVAYGAGSDSTGIAVTWCILAMVLYPEVQRKAQAELDAVLGMDHLPGFEDQEHLPYINALCKEIQRWNPVAPLGVAHAVSEDDLYREYFIPKGSIVIGNAWAMLQDSKAFGARPEEFRPERFLEPGVCEPNIAFGFGRRICPGRYMAANTIFIAVASILKVFNISHATDSEGNKIPVRAVSTLGTITQPEDFRCSIKPRSPTAENLILAQCNE